MHNFNDQWYFFSKLLIDTVSLYQNSSVWLDMNNASSWDRNPPNIMLDFVSYRSATRV